MPKSRKSFSSSSSYSSSSPSSFKSLSKQKSYKQKSSNMNKNKNKYSDSNMILMFLQMLNTTKLYHWKTKSFAQHKATDELYSDLNSTIDKFVEVMLGKTDGKRINLTNIKSLPLSECNDVNGFKREIEIYKNYLIGIASVLDSNKDTDLLNIKDEMLGHLNQFTYLLSFNHL